MNEEVKYGVPLNFYLDILFLLCTISNCFLLSHHKIHIINFSKGIRYMKKITGFFVVTLILALVGCDEKNLVKQNVSEGNFTAKQETLSSNNKVDIKADLTVLNAVVDASNDAAIKMRSEMLNAAQKQDKNAVNAVLENVKDNIDKTNQQLVALNIKSKEIQSIRVNVFAANKMAAQIIEMSQKGDTLSDEEKSELRLLQKKSVAMQMSVGQQLDEFNKE